MQLRHFKDEAAVKLKVNWLQSWAVRFNDNNHRFHVGGNNHFDNNNGQSRGMTLETKTLPIMNCTNLYEHICSYENLECAYRKARKGNFIGRLKRK